MARLQRGRDEARLSSHLSAHLQWNQWQWWCCPQGNSTFLMQVTRGSHGSSYKQEIIPVPRATCLHPQLVPAGNHQVSSGGFVPVQGRGIWLCQLSTTFRSQLSSHPHQKHLTSEKLSLRKPETFRLERKTKRTFTWYSETTQLLKLKTTAL